MPRTDETKEMIKEIEAFTKHFPGVKRIVSDRLSDILCDIEEDIDESMYENVTPTSSMKNCIGLELEFFSTKDFMFIVKSLAKHNIAKRSSLGDDGSIRPPRGSRSYELRLLMTEKDYTNILNNLNKVIKECKIKVNKTCGMHVHIDMRNRDYETVLKNYFKCLPIMKKLVAKHRLNNRFCIIENNWTEQKRDQLGWNYANRQVAINALNAYQSHSTFEIRLHEAITDITKMKNWIKFLVSIANHKTEITKGKSSKDFLKTVKPLRGVKSYLEKAGA